MTDERKTHPTDHKAVKIDDIMCVMHYVKVLDVLKGGEELRVQDLDRTGEFHVRGRDLVSAALSADHSAEEVKLSRTAIAELLTSSYNRPFTVCFQKVDGSQRILRGRLINPEPLLGRSHVEDLDLKAGDRMRLVDHRTIEWLKVDGVKYLVK